MRRGVAGMLGRTRRSGTDCQQIEWLMVSYHTIGCCLVPNNKLRVYSRAGHSLSSDFIPFVQRWWLERERDPPGYTSPSSLSLSRPLNFNFTVILWAVSFLQIPQME